MDGSGSRYPLEDINVSRNAEWWTRKRRRIMNGDLRISENGEPAEGWVWMPLPGRNNVKELVEHAIQKQETTNVDADKQARHVQEVEEGTRDED